MITFTMSSPPDVIEPQPMQVELKEEVTVSDKVEARKESKAAAKDEKKAIQEARTISKNAENEQDRKNAKDTLKEVDNSPTANQKKK